MLFELLSVFVFIASIVYLLLTVNYGYWKRRNVPQAPTSYFGGNIGQSLKMKKNLCVVYADIYQQFEKYPFVGIYKVFTPSLLIRDPEVIKEVTVKAFSNFYDNTITFDEEDPVIGRNPFVLNGNKWKTVRSQLTPLFTSSKVKPIVAIFDEGGKNMVKYIEKSGDRTELDAKDLTTRYSVDNVVSYALGLDAKCFEDDNSEFKKLAYDLFGGSFLQLLLISVSLIFPVLVNYLKIRFVGKTTEKQFRAIISRSIKHRLENNIVRNDLLSSLISMYNSGVFTEQDISVTIGGFYIDGIETSATVLHFFLYELAAHPSAQSKLKAEIDEVLAEYDGTVTYDALQKMKFLDAALNETLRLNAPIPFMDRQTTQKTTLCGSTSDGKQMEVTVEVGTPVIIPIRGIHMDEKYFPDPLAFKPERFLGENKDHIQKYTFLPFGEGPRICLGKTFGTVQVKVGAIHVLKNFRLSLGSKVSYPINVDPSSFVLRPSEPIKIKFSKWD